MVRVRRGAEAGASARIPTGPSCADRFTDSFDVEWPPYRLLACRFSFVDRLAFFLTFFLAFMDVAIPASL